MLLSVCNSLALCTKTALISFVVCVDFDRSSWCAEASAVVVGISSVHVQALFVSSSSCAVFFGECQLGTQHMCVKNRLLCPLLCQVSGLGRLQFDLRLHECSSNSMTWHDAQSVK